MLDSLWGAEFDIDNSEKTKKIIKKIKEPKVVKVTVEKQIKSKKVSIEDKIAIITENVNKTLGKQKDNIIVIYTVDDLHNYISQSLANGVIAVDTETNNSLDPLTCKLMGLCLYTPGQKQAYIPVNHINHVTGERLPCQLTEKQIADELSRICGDNIKIIMHNYKFDFQVLKCTCGIEVPCYWDTLIAAKLINETESASLKEQYIKHIDSEQEKYSIEKLFEKQEYAIFPPELFALYAATDAMMTYRLYNEYQKSIMESDDFKDIYNKVFMQIEMPCIRVVADMELNGIELDVEYAKRLSDKYHTKLSNIDAKINDELSNYKEQIDAWKLTPEANEKSKKVDKTGETVEGKSKAEQLEEPINLASPTQLAILLYDIIKVGIIDEKTPRGTGADILKKIDLPLCKLLLERREVVKLLDGYIDVLPKIAEASPDGRIRTHFNQYGADTGRFSSSNPINLQNIPSHNKEIRMLFKAKCEEKDVDISDDNYYDISSISEVLTTEGWKSIKNITVGDTIVGDDSTDIVTRIEVIGDSYRLYV